MANPETSDVAPPSIALARMAICLAEERAEQAMRGIKGLWTVHKIEPNPRDLVNPAIHPCSAEYYRIIDRISRGEHP